MKSTISTLLLFISCYCCFTQPVANKALRVNVQDENGTALQRATVHLLLTDSTLIQTTVSDSKGQAEIQNLAPRKYIIKANFLGYETSFSSIIDLEKSLFFSVNVIMKPEAGLLGDVTVTSKKPLVQFLPDKTVINVDASITNTGTTVMEVLEKSPGIAVDRNGNISMKGRPAVNVMIDGKMTQLSGTDLQNLLSGMSSSQVDVIELIENPGAKYDAAGNAGIINIKTKKNKQKGFNGSLSSSFGQGRLPKNNNSLIFNIRSGSLNFFASYSSNFNKSLMNMYALRTYYNENDGTVSSLLKQPYRTRTKSSTHNIRTGVDYFVNQKTTVGAAFTGTYLNRESNTASTIEWLDKFGTLDSTISTTGLRNTKLEQAGLNFNARHTFDANRELTADVDFVKYNIRNDQYFENQLLVPGSIVEASKGEIPSKLNIFSAKADYSHRFKNTLWESGVKSARVETDNLAQYFIRNGNQQWEDDLGKSNHFLYTENIHAIYSSIDNKKGKWHWQTGLRYENTSYKAKQLGNAVIKDSSFNRNYSSLFPTAFVTYEADSSNSFTFRAGRRIDRPQFHRLNPFVFFLNKYTLEKGNPFFKPQFTWNLELNHVYKQVLSTSLTYNFTKDYMSQIFLADTSNGTIVYTQGNVGKLQNIGLSMSLQLSPKKWWSLTAQAVYNHKIIEGFVWEPFKTNIDQVTLNINNQFRFGKGWGAELSGYFISRNQNDLQEVLDPTGQVGIGLSKQVFKNKGTIRFTFRDIFYSQDMEGDSRFENSDEYFRLQWDSQVATVGFVYRFGKAMKQPKRSGGGAADEINRVGTGN
jgi:iron complex outermembrane receptor protein